MALTVEQEGAITPASDGVEENIFTETTTGTYVFAIDTENLAAGEHLEVRMKIKVRSTGSSLGVYTMGTYGGVNDEALVSPALPVRHELVVTIKQTGGTLRSFPYELIKLD